MKKRLKFGLAPAVVLLFLSCSKHHDSGDTNCISRIEPSSVSALPADQLDSITVLFRQNQLSTAGLQFLFFAVYTVVQPGFSGTEQQVQANFSLNTLPVFSLSENFIFNQGVYQPSASNLYTGAIPNGDTTGHRTLASLRSIYLSNYKQMVIGGGCSGCQFRHPSPTYNDSCLTAELGYADAAYFNNGATPYGSVLMKAWKVSPLSGGFPTIYIQDSTGIAYPLDLIYP